MSGSILSLLSNSDNAFCNRELYGCHQQVNRENSYKEYKNQSNYERQNLDTSDGFLAFSRDLQRPYQPRNTNYCQMNNFNLCAEKPVIMAHASKEINTRNPSTSPKIVGVERKKNINYQPVYMQRHSIALGNGLTNMANLQQENQQRNKILNQSKRISIAEAIITPPAPQVDKPQANTNPFSVKDRISFFNKLATDNGHRNVQPKPKETFVSLLRRKEPKTSIIRLSQLIEAASLTRSPAKIPSKEPINGLNSSATRCSTHVFKLGTYSLPTQLKRKPSFEKTKVVPSSIAKTSANYGTNPRRHCLMEDLSMVVPVKLRIAEFEKRIVNI